MSKQPSDATQLRYVKAALRTAQAEILRLKIELIQYQGRATKAEQEVVEWKARFDVLLRREEVKP